VSIFTKKKDAEVEIYKADTESNIAIAKTWSDNRARKEDGIALQFLRDLLCFGPIMWVDIIIWDKIVATSHPTWVVGVLPLPESIAYMPGAVVVFLLGNIGLNMWKTK
jgi:hypothetical protein